MRRNTLAIQMEKRVHEVNAMLPEHDRRTLGMIPKSRRA